jgi:hypothetical protein
MAKQFKLNYQVMETDTTAILTTKTGLISTPARVAVLCCLRESNAR